MEKQLAVFDLDNEDYGIDIAGVDSIVKMQAITDVPHALDFVKGITNLHGEALPVLDLRRRFGLSPEEISGDTRIVNVEIEDDGQWGSKVGMVVDALSEMLRVSDEDVAPPSPIVTTVTGDAASLTGTARANAGPDPSERLVILLDLAESL